MAIDSKAKRWAASGAGRPWMRSNFPATKDATWRPGAGNAYPVATFSNPVAPTAFPWLYYAQQHQLGI